MNAAVRLLSASVLLLLAAGARAHGDTVWSVTFPAATGYFKTNVVAASGAISKTLAVSAAFNGSAGYASASGSSGTAVGSGKTQLSRFSLTIPSFAPDYRVESISVTTSCNSSGGMFPWMGSSSTVSLAASVGGTACAPASSTLSSSSEAHAFTPAAGADSGDIVLAWSVSPASAKRTVYIKSLSIGLAAANTAPELSLSAAAVHVLAGETAGIVATATDTAAAPLLAVDAAFADSLSVSASSATSTGVFAWRVPCPGEYAIDFTATDSDASPALSAFRTLRVSAGLAAPSAVSAAVLNANQATLSCGGSAGAAEYEVSLAAGNGGADTSVVYAFPEALDGLEPGTVYHGAIAAINGAYRSAPAEFSFETPRLPVWTLILVR